VIRSKWAVRKQEPELASGAKSIKKTSHARKPLAQKLQHSKYLAVMATELKRSKRTQENNMRWRKKTLVKRVHDFGKDFGDVYNIEVALIIRQNGRYFTYRSVDIDSWPPPMQQIVRDLTLMMFKAKIKAASSIPASKECAS